MSPEYFCQTIIRKMIKRKTAQCVKCRLSARTELSLNAYGLGRTMLEAIMSVWDFYEFIIFIDRHDRRGVAIKAIVEEIF